MARGAHSGALFACLGDEVSTIVWMPVRPLRQLLLSIACLWGAASLVAEPVQDLPKPTNYVSDFAGVLSPETVQGLDSLCARVDRLAHAQIAVVTVKSLDGEPIESYTHRT